MSRIVRAAFIAEDDEGKRMLYEFDPSHPIALTMDRPEPALDFTGRWVTSPVPTRLVVEGVFAGGTIWDGDVPSASSQPRAVTERGSDRS